jgi:hypothetical protein
MKITVTKSDIELGKRNVVDGRRCPIALACKRAGFVFDYIYSSCYTTTGPLMPVTRAKNPKRLPKKVIKFIEDLCCDRPVKPFSFNLPVRETSRT